MRGPVAHLLVLFALTIGGEAEARDVNTPDWFAVPVDTEKDLQEYDLAQYISEALASWVPIRYHAFCEQRRRTEDRYWQLSVAIAHVAMTHEPVFDDDPKHVKTALLLASIASYEGQMVARYMTCKEYGMGKALGPYQCQGEACRPHVCGSYLQATEWALEGKGQVRESFFVCHAYDVRDRLAGYTDGACQRNWDRSRVRVQRALKYYAQRPMDYGVD